MSSDNLAIDIYKPSAPVEETVEVKDRPTRRSVVDTKRTTQKVYPSLENEQKSEIAEVRIVPFQKRTRSAESSPRDSDEEKQLTKYHSTENLPSKKRNKLVEERDILKTALIEIHQTINQYKLELEAAKDKATTKQLKTRLKDKDLEYKLISEKLIAAETKIQDLENQGLALLQTATIQQQSIEYQATSLTQQLEQTQGEKTNLITTLVKKTQDVQILESTIRKVETEHTSVKTKLIKDKKKLQQELEKLKERESQLLGEGTTLLNKYSNIQIEFEKLQLSYKALETKSIDQEKEIHALQVEHKKLIVHITDKNQEISHLNDTIQTKQAELEFLRQEQIDQTSKIVNLQTENNQLKHNLNISQINETTLHDKQTKQTIEISTLQTANQSLEEKFKRLQQTIASAASTNELEIAQHTLAIQNRKIVSLENELTELGQALQLAKQAAERAAKLDTENNYLKGSIEQLNKNNLTLLEQLAQPAIETDTTNETPRMTANDDIRALAVAITRRDETQNIPIYSGNVNDQPIGVWLRDAEAIATIHEWPRESTKKILATRLKGTALQWHIDRLRVAPRESYSDWRNALKEHFKHPADKAKQKSKLLSVKQSPNQPVRHFIDKITQAYSAIYKEGDEEQAESAELTALKDDTLIKMLLDGLLPTIKTILFHNKYPSTPNWQNFKQAALESEEIAYNTQALELKPIFKFEVPKPTRDIEAELTQTKLELEELKNNLTKLNLSGTASKSGQDWSVNNIDTYKQGRDSSRYNNVKWEDRQRSRDNSYSRDRRDHSYNRNRSYDRNRSESRERSYGKERYQDKRYQNRERLDSRTRRYDERPRSKSPHPSAELARKQRLSGNNRENTITCHRCLNTGHIAKDCRTKNPRRFQSKTE
ncbi:myosin-J heavy chain-like [Daphnia carinata]|uniref:myosin-J heavy chain-like n=1 Tax=Daphnia carinata TaxID=120202 RepID=UPI00257ADB56|nr:myosin-J heavy chain-like [Daphnia carinata]